MTTGAQAFDGPPSNSLALLALGESCFLRLMLVLLVLRLNIIPQTPLIHGVASGWRAQYPSSVPANHNPLRVV
jgi:hypothetical protein